MFQTILVPLDGSKRAERILSHVENLALNSKSKIVFLRVVKSQHHAAGDRDCADWYNQELWRKTRIAETYLSGLKGEFREKGVDSVIHVLNGAIVKSILKIAEQEDADLVAIASHCRKGLGRLVNGSVATGVIKHTDRPVLITHTNDVKLWFGDVHTNAHVYRAVIEGLADGMHKIETAGKMRTRKLAVSGGASQSDQIYQAPIS